MILNDIFRLWIELNTYKWINNKYARKIVRLWWVYFPWSLWGRPIPWYGNTRPEFGSASHESFSPGSPRKWARPARHTSRIHSSLTKSSAENIEKVLWFWKRFIYRNWIISILKIQKPIERLDRINWTLEKQRRCIMYSILTQFYISVCAKIVHIVIMYKINIFAWFDWTSILKIQNPFDGFK